VQGKAARRWGGHEQFFLFPLFEAGKVYKLKPKQFVFYTRLFKNARHVPLAFFQARLKKNRSRKQWAKRVVDEVRSVWGKHSTLLEKWRPQALAAQRSAVGPIKQELYFATHRRGSRKLLLVSEFSGAISCLSKLSRPARDQMLPGPL